MTSVRPEFRSLTPTQQQQFVRGVAGLNAQFTPTRYDKFTQTDAMAAPAVLGHAGYLPFLRGATAAAPAQRIVNPDRAG